MTDLSLDDYKSIMAGKWVGYFKSYHVDPSFIYYNVETTIGDDGSLANIIQYSSWSENSTSVNPYYKFNSINLSAVLANGKGEGIAGVIDPEWPTSDYPAIIKDVAISNDGNYIKFVIVYVSYPFEHYLFRKPE